MAWVVDGGGHLAAIQERGQEKREKLQGGHPAPGYLKTDDENLEH